MSGILLRYEVPQEQEEEDRSHAGPRPRPQAPAVFDRSRASQAPPPEVPSVGTTRHSQSYGSELATTARGASGDACTRRDGRAGSTPAGAALVLVGRTRLPGRAPLTRSASLRGATRTGVVIASGASSGSEAIWERGCSRSRVASPLNVRGSHQNAWNARNSRKRANAPDHGASDERGEVSSCPRQHGRRARQRLAVAVDRSARGVRSEQVPVGDRLRLATEVPPA